MMSGSSTRDSYVVKRPLMTITYCRTTEAAEVAEAVVGLFSLAVADNVAAANHGRGHWRQLLSHSFVLAFWYTNS